MLSFRDLDELLAARGIIVIYEAIRQWTLKFGQSFANELRRRQPRRGDKWHLDEMVITMNGKWRAVDQEGCILDILVQSRRNAKAAKRLLHKLLKGLHSVPRVLVTDKLKSYTAAKRTVMPGIEHRLGDGSRSADHRSQEECSIWTCAKLAENGERDSSDRKYSAKHF